jgi:hypothetical protein
VRHFVFFFFMPVCPDCSFDCRRNNSASTHN